MNNTLEKAVANKLFMKWTDEIPDLDITYFGKQDYKTYPSYFLDFRVNDFFIEIDFVENNYKVKDIKLNINAWKDIDKALKEHCNYTEHRMFTVPITTTMSEILERAEKEFDFNIPLRKVKVSEIDTTQFYKDLRWLCSINHNFEKEESDRLWTDVTVHNLSKKDYDKYKQSILVSREWQVYYSRGQLLYILDRMMK